MGKLYQQVGQYLSGLCTDEVIVEIGSDRWEGSSAYFADLAKTHSMKFVSVDLDKDAARRIRRSINPDNASTTEFVLAEGTVWTAGYSGSLVRVLYLDNFDWDWSTNRHSDMIEEQRQWYASNGITMNNLNSQTAHIAQMMNLMPHMSNQCLICIDDTYEYNGVFIGKGGAVVPYLLAQQFVVLAVRDYGVILGRGYSNNIV